MGIVGAALAFLLGLRVGPRGSGIALRVIAIGAALLAIWTRYEWATAHRATTLVMLGGAGALALISSSLALVGPSAFKDWRMALILSAALVTGFHLIPANLTMCAVLGVC